MDNDHKYLKHFILINYFFKNNIENINSINDFEILKIKNDKKITTLNIIYRSNESKNKKNINSYLINTKLKYFNRELISFTKSKSNKINKIYQKKQSIKKLYSFFNYEKK